MVISATASVSAGMVTAAVMCAPARLDNGPALLAFRQMLAGRDCGDVAIAGHVIVVVALQRQRSLPVSTIQ
jgi:hypothetical protein